MTTATNDIITDTIIGITATIDQHLAGYCEPDPARRAELITDAWSAQGTLVDPPMDGTGHDEICRLVDIVLTHFPGHHFVRTSAVDTHHDMARYAWSLVDPDGTEATSGLDVAQFDADGKLLHITGFFGPLMPVD